MYSIPQLLTTTDLYPESDHGQYNLQQILVVNDQMIHKWVDVNGQEY